MRPYISCTHKYRAKSLHVDLGQVLVGEILRALILLYKFPFSLQETSDLALNLVRFTRICTTPREFLLLNPQSVILKTLNGARVGGQ